MNKLIIRNEQEKDYHVVEEAIREAFWNLYIPGCDEHYLVHIMRNSPDYIPELTFLAEIDGRIVGSIFFTKSYVLDEMGMKHDTITFGPVSVLPELHNHGVGNTLIEHAKQAAISLGYKAILIYGYPNYYKTLGFHHAKEFRISDPDGKYPFAHMVLELYTGALSGISGKAFESSIYNIDEKMVLKYDTKFKPKEKMVTPSQKLFEETASKFL